MLGSPAEHTNAGQKGPVQVNPNDLKIPLQETDQNHNSGNLGRELAQNLTSMQIHSPFKGGAEEEKKHGNN